MESSGGKLFSIIIPNLNKASNLPSLLDSIFANDMGNDFEVHFLDDLSDDDSVSIASRYPVALYRSPARVGPAALRNRGARLAKGAYLLFVDSDVILFPDTLIHFQKVCRKNEVHFVTGRETLPCAVDNWIGTFRTLQLQELLGGDAAQERIIEGWGSTFGGIRKEAFFHAGGFSEIYRGADIEDHELCARARKHYPMHYDPKLRYRHTYRSAKELLGKQFKRAAQMMQLERGEVLSNRSFYQLKFKIGHALSLAILAALGASLISSSALLAAAALLAVKCVFHRVLLKQSWTLKGPIFCLYSLAIHTAMAPVILLGVSTGLARRAAR